jgi:lipopolysaccharide transport system ATP-binding protein
MYVRLAFAIAAHLEGDILIVDEVLAVGDASFQAKCLAKMDEARANGRTVLLASHDLTAVGRHCARTLWLEEGNVKAFGPTPGVVASYVDAGRGTPRNERVWERDAAPANETIRLLALRVHSDAPPVLIPGSSSCHDQLAPLKLEVEFEVLRRIEPRLRVLIWFIRSDGLNAMCIADSDGTGWLEKPREVGSYMSRCEIPGRWLNADTYFLHVHFDVPGMACLLPVNNVIRLDLAFGSLKGPIFSVSERLPSVACPHLQWEVTRRDLS